MTELKQILDKKELWELGPLLKISKDLMFEITQLDKQDPN